MTTRFPVSEYYADNVLDGVTISRTGRWWSAVLLIKDPRAIRHILCIYKWQLKDGKWRRAQAFKINKPTHARTLAEAVLKLVTRCDDPAGDAKETDAEEM